MTGTFPKLWLAFSANLNEFLSKQTYNKDKEPYHFLSREGFREARKSTVSVQCDHYFHKGIHRVLWKMKMVRTRGLHERHWRWILLLFRQGKRVLEYTEVEKWWPGPRNTEVQSQLVVTAGAGGMQSAGAKFKGRCTRCQFSF